MNLEYILFFALTRVGSKRFVYFAFISLTTWSIFFTVDPSVFLLLLLSLLPTLPSSPSMTPPEKEPKGLIRREAALNARDAITHQYATSTKKETKTPSTKKFPGPISRYKTAPSNKRLAILLSSDGEDQPPRKRTTATLSSTTNNTDLLQTESPS